KTTPHPQPHHGGEPTTLPADTKPCNLFGFAVSIGVMLFRGPILCLIAGLATVTACTEPLDHSLTLPFPVSINNGLLSAYGEVLPNMDLRCGVDPGDNPPPTPGSQRILIDLATSLTVFADNSGQPPQPFRDGQLQINATQPDGTMGSPRFMLCD